jgi:hypothetical protein
LEIDPSLASLALARHPRGREAFFSGPFVIFPFSFAVDLEFRARGRTATISDDSDDSNFDDFNSFRLLLFAQS